MCPKTKKSYVIIIEAFGCFYNTKLYQNPPLSCSPSLKLSIMQRRRSFWWQKKYLWMKSQFLSFSNTIPTIPYHFSQTPGEYQTKSLTQRPHTFFSISRKTCFHFRDQRDSRFSRILENLFLIFTSRSRSRAVSISLSLLEKEWRDWSGSDMLFQNKICHVRQFLPF